jgi:hypothetical protein
MSRSDVHIVAAAEAMVATDDNRLHDDMIADDDTSERELTILQKVTVEWHTRCRKILISATDHSIVVAS